MKICAETATDESQASSTDLTMAAEGSNSLGTSQKTSSHLRKHVASTHYCRSSLSDAQITDKDGTRRTIDEVAESK